MKKGFIRKIPRFPVEDQRRVLLLHLPEKAIYEHGRGLESLDAILATVRDADREKEILIAADLRVFGDARKAILANIDRITDKGIVIRDVAHPEDTTLPKMLDRAFTAAASHQRWKGAKKAAEKAGRKGGLIHGEIAKARRYGNVDEDTARKIWTAPKLTIAEKLYILGPEWNKSTATRQFGKSRG